MLITFQCSSKTGLDKLRKLTSGAHGLLTHHHAPFSFLTVLCFPSAVQKHVRRHEFDWKPNVSLILNDITNSNMLSFSFWTTCRHRHSQGGLIFAARTELMAVLQQEMNRLGISWTPPTYHVVTDSPGSIAGVL